MAAGSAGEGAGSNTELRWRRFQDYIACQSEMGNGTSRRDRVSVLTNLGTDFRLGQ